MTRYVEDEVERYVVLYIYSDSASGELCFGNGEGGQSIAQNVFVNEGPCVANGYFLSSAYGTCLCHNEVDYQVQHPVGFDRHELDL